MNGDGNEIPPSAICNGTNAVITVLNYGGADYMEEENPPPAAAAAANQQIVVGISTIQSHLR